MRCVLPRSTGEPDWPELADARAVPGQQFAQDRAMAMRLVLAVTADREIAVLRQRREQGQRVPVLRRCHLGAVAAGEIGPFGRRPGRLCQLYQPGTGGE